MRKLGLALIVATALSVGVGSASGRTSGPQPSCGDTITVNTKLTGDLTNCPGDGLVIGADDITLDLNGHTIDGDNVPAPCDPSVCETDFGIDNTGGHSNVTIRGGTVQEFDIGAGADGASQSRVRDMSALSNLAFGVLLSNSTDSVIAKSSLSGNEISGVVLVDSSGNEIERNSLSDNGQTAAFLFSSNDNDLEKNVFDGNDEGIAVHAGRGNQLRRNSISHSTGAGILVGDGGSRNLVERNRLAGNGDGIVFDGDDNAVVANFVADTVGCDGECGGGISIEGGRNNVVAQNTVIRTSRQGIRLNAFEDFGGPPAIGTVIRDNSVRAAGIDGIAVGTETEGSGTVAGTVLEGNATIGSGDDGIDVKRRDTTLTRNLAFRNGDLGIEAVAGVTDGGGNHAAANGNPAQCTNVACKGRVPSAAAARLRKLHPQLISHRPVKGARGAGDLRRRSVQARAEADHALGKLRGQDRLLPWRKAHRLLEAPSSESPAARRPTSTPCRRTGRTSCNSPTSAGAQSNDGADSWSSDGRKIAFVSNRTGKYQIWTMNAAGTDATRLTHGPEAHLAACGSHP
jgi:parallel beta-helix repeat protein